MNFCKITSPVTFTMAAKTILCVKLSLFNTLVKVKTLTDNGLYPAEYSVYLSISEPYSDYMGNV